MGASGYKILDLTISANTPDGNTWFEITQKVSGVNVSRRISAPTLAAYFAPDLSAYLTSATAAATYVPLTRNLTINGTTYNLSADRSWTIPTGGNETLAQTLALGNTSGANDIVMSTTQDIGFINGDNNFTTYLSNDQTTGGNREVFLPLYDGQLAYHATGVPLVSGRITHATTNGALTDNASLTTDATTRLYTKGSTTNSTAYYFKGDDSSSAARFYGRNDGAHAINSSSLVSSAALKIKGRLIVSTQEVTNNDYYNFMCEVGVGNGVLFSDGTNGASLNNQLGRIFGDGGLQIYGRNNADATKFFFSGKATANRFEFYSDDANTNFKMTSTGVLYYTQAVNSDGFNVIRSNAATTTPTAYSAISVINADTTANRVSVIGFAYQDNVARSGFIAARFINNTNGDLLLGNKKSGTEQTVLELTANGNQIMGTQAALSTNATDGFLYAPSCAGTPTGTPTAYTGKTACVVDSTNGKFYIYSGGAWVALN